ncbi:antibiotic biosynthesis monooxygenase [Nostoc linckia z18]|jgi:quinol monooxygenase YgiN|uniref:Antibiotic biosynthesis monooxygenase n=2 Tax=Nostoc linckia TaxID=92942 RepID=A0A9Q6EIR4_NOSLI|nr:MULTISPECIES: putative quinol monooxygenase [Nostoc]PHK28034.1 antibiotic biosynthesis monooxygenase [Nostoc linckia z15]PHK38515.1 antibiotic biosynthesis monooxygenase [Nostoc linckia z16]MBC1241728.1 antibiotic biosynthesis monooxygenase [Nostoc sp. 2RC]PHJ53443.1 antibiotic biosynthesis monooxygenase [Nostoc linckia z1]PHJ71677.1 antibiotic biosynthesis monooxygenase [Nostoc linckia z3]
MTNQTIRVIAHVIALPNKVEELKAVLLELVEPTRQEPGAIKYELLQNQYDPTDFTFVEEWISNEALNTHMDTPHFQEAAAKLDGLVAAAPDIRRYHLLA